MIQDWDFTFNCEEDFNLMNNVFNNVFLDSFLLKKKSQSIIKNSISSNLKNKKLKVSFVTSNFVDPIIILEKIKESCKNKDFNYMFTITDTEASNKLFLKSFNCPKKYNIVYDLKRLMLYAREHKLKSYNLFLKTKTAKRESFNSIKEVLTYLQNTFGENITKEFFNINSDDLEYNFNHISYSLAQKLGIEICAYRLYFPAKKSLFENSVPVGHLNNIATFNNDLNSILNNIIKVEYPYAASVFDEDIIRSLEEEVRYRKPDEIQDIIYNIKHICNLLEVGVDMSTYKMCDVKMIYHTKFVILKRYYHYKHNVIANMIMASLNISHTKYKKIKDAIYREIIHNFSKDGCYSNECILNIFLENYKKYLTFKDTTDSEDVNKAITINLDYFRDAFFEIDRAIRNENLKLT